MSRSLQVDAVVVGAGLAGLACAQDLCDAGLNVMLLESARCPGGRMVSDRRDGFVLDRGFQVFNTAYPQVKRRLDLKALQLRAFEPGFVLARGTRRFELADPTRKPAALTALLRVGSVRDLAALTALSARDMFAPASLLTRGSDVTARQALCDAGLSDRFAETVVAPFLRGVFLDQGLSVSGRFFHLVWHSMLRGTLCLPERGIGQVPRQLADRLPMGVLRLGSPVEQVGDGGVRLVGGFLLRAPVVVVATGPRAAMSLLPGLPVVSTRAVTTVYHAAPQAPWPGKQLLVDGDGLLLHTCVVSNVQPAYAPSGKALVSTSLLGKATLEQIEEAERRLGEVYRTSTRSWERIAVHHVREALPALSASQPLTRTTRVSPGRYVCGDHRATASVQGALASGARAAREVLHGLATKAHQTAMTSTVSSQPCGAPFHPNVSGTCQENPVSDHDLLLDDTITTIVTDEADALVELVADGIMWRGTPVTSSSWARSLPRRPVERTSLRDRLAVSGYLHLERACYRLGERWAPVGHVRLRLDSVSAWWLRGSALADPSDGEQPEATATDPEPAS